MAGPSWKRRATSADVARASGVSRSTVSFVLNDTPTQSISAATRERVLKAAKDLGYTPNPLGLALAKGRTKLVVLDMGSIPISEYMIGEFVSAVSQRVTELGMTAIIHGTGDATPDSLLRLVNATQPFAVITQASTSTELLEKLRAAGVEYVHGLDQADSGLEMDWNAEVARLQLEHLRERGHTTLAYATPDRRELDRVVRQRGRAMRDEARRVETALAPTLALGHDRASTRRAVDRFITRNPEVTAFACYNDDVAMALLGVLSDLGIPVPSRLAVIGVDDKPFSEYSMPALTTLRTDIARLASHVTAAFLHATEDKDPPAQPDTSGFTLVARDST